MRNQMNQLICLDANLPDMARLRQGAIAGSQVVELTGDRDAFHQIALALADFGDGAVQGLHIVCHGAPGCLYFGDDCIDTASLAQYSAVFAAWKSHCAPQSAIYLYGCEVGAGLVGETFVQELSRLVGLPVAASATLTGNAALGGDWALTVRWSTTDGWSSGEVAPSIAFTAITQRDYAGVLNNPTFGVTDLGTTNLLYNNGSATQTGNSLLLTNDQTFQRASSFLIVPVDLTPTTAFNTSFQFRLGGAAGTNGTDGFTFTLQNSAAGVTALGSDGGNMGYGGIGRSLAIKFDTFQNAGIDLSDNTVSIVRDGSVLSSIVAANAAVDLNDGQLHTAWIDYDGLTDVLNVYVGDNAKPLQATLSTTIDLTSIVGNQAYVGFTAGTGFIGAQQEILNWGLATPNPQAAAAPPAAPIATLNLATLPAAALNLNGAANRLGTTIELTPDQVHSRGSAYYATPLQVNANTGFKTQFQFVLDGQAGSAGADGFSFVLQNSAEGARALGGVGSYVGLGDVLNSLAVKFDTYQNPGDIAGNTVSIVRNGDVYNPVVVQATPFDLNNGATYSAWVEYDGLTNQLTVFLADGTAKPPTAILTTTTDLFTTVGNQAFVGFTAAAGGIANRQSITGWQFQADAAIGNGDGLRAEYFDNVDFTNLKYVQVDPTVNYNWGAAAPSANLAPDTFSVRWNGQVQSLYNEEYTFYTTSDEGVQLTVNGVVLVNQLVNQLPTEWSGKLTLEAGQKYDIELKYFDDLGNAQVQLAWSSASQLRQVIPQSQLFTKPYAPGTILMGSEAFSVLENAGTAAVRFDRIDGSDGYATVNYSLTGTGPGVLFANGGGTVTFKPGEIAQTINVPLVNNAVVGLNQGFNVALGQTAGAGLGTRRTVGITILDDDGGVSVFNLAQATSQVLENAGIAKITIQRSGDTTIASSVGYTLTNGTAIAGTDFVGGTGVVNFVAGESSKTFDVAIIDNTVPNLNKTLNIALDTPTNGTIGTQIAAAVLTIQDNDTATALVRQDFATGLEQPTAFEFAPGGNLLFVAEKRGTVKVFDKNGVAQGTFIDLSDEVNGARDRGLIGIAVDPQFLTGRPYIYLSYTYDPPEAVIKDQANNRPSRLVRVKADAATGFTRAVGVADPEHEVVILGKNSTWANTSRPDLNSTTDVQNGNPLFEPVNPPSGRTRNPDGTYTNLQDYLATDSESHSIGDVSFGPDGYLYVTNGDGTSYNAVDARAFRVLDINNLSGKLLRIDPTTGAGVAGNPFYDAANPNSNASKVVSWGLRNPFRFTFNPLTNAPVIGDVGWGTYEEINVGAGKNFGWPYFEGGPGGVPLQTSGYNERPEALAFYNSGIITTAPAYAYKHAGPSNAIVVGDFYRGTSAPYQNGLFVADVAAGTVKVEFFDPTGTTVDTTKEIALANNFYGVAQMNSGVDGSMYYAKLGVEGAGNGSIGRWVAV
jgi:glucose/arabinose dehydrogenase